MANRRQFIKLSFMGAGAVAISSGAFGAINFLSDPENAKRLKVDLKRTPTYCEVCFWKCAGWVYKTSEGQIWKII
jgi:thiosulfate reductase / polysulfide reductase chain A